MNSRYYGCPPGYTTRLQSWDKYRELELSNKQAVTEEGSLLEYETLELRIHPPNVRIDNDSYEDKTVLIIDSANRPGTLVEVVQCLTELGLSVKQARISSDGGWFVDEFHVSETPSGRVVDPKKLNAIKSVLSIKDDHLGQAPEIHTVFQIAGPETPGILADITQLLSHNGLEIRTAAAWTYNGRAAVVIGVTERNAAVYDKVKLHRLKQLLTRMVEKNGDAAVSVEQVEGPIHHERRLHQLLLADEIQAWKQLSRLQRQHSLPFPGPINTHNSAGQDVDGDADQHQLPHTPKTPQQQWQRKMLPPMWTVDQRGKPLVKVDAMQQLLMQQQHQPQQRRQSDSSQQQPSSSMQQPPLSSVAEDTYNVDAGSVAGNRAQSSSPPDVPRTPSHTLPPLPHLPSAQLPIPVAAGGRRTSGQDGAAADSAAQQASVDKLIALLQPKPLQHAISMPPARIIATAGDRTPAGAAATAQESDTAEATAQGINTAERHQQPQQQQQLQAADPWRARAASDTGATPVALAAVANAGLPPRPPYTPSPLVISSQMSDVSVQLQSSVSAPSSPHATSGLAASNAANGASHSNSVDFEGSAAGAAGNVVSRHASSDAFVPGQGVMWSPGRYASASAAAGQLSPRGHAPLTTAQSSAALVGLQQFGVGGSLKDNPEVQVQHSSLFNYWLVTIRCRDRNKLFFDTVCTLCDMRFDIYHATIDGEPSGTATQLFYIRPRFGETAFDDRRAAVLKAMLTSAVQRRFPPGLRVHVFSGNTVCLQDLIRAMKLHKLTITRCKVRAYECASHTFYLMNPDGSLPSKHFVQKACQSAGGELVEAPLDLANPCVATVLKSLDVRGRFAFSFADKRTSLAHTSMLSVDGGIGYMVTGVRGAHGLRSLVPLARGSGVLREHRDEMGSGSIGQPSF